MNDALVSGWGIVYLHLSYRDPAAAIGFLTDAFGLRERVRMVRDDGSVIVAKLELILMAPTDHPWGLRTYAALDPEGHQWEFCQVLAAVAPEAWGATVVS